jgi:hypothetical protein
MCEKKEPCTDWKPRPPAAMVRLLLLPVCAALACACSGSGGHNSLVAGDLVAGNDGPTEDSPGTGDSLPTDALGADALDSGLSDSEPYLPDGAVASDAPSADATVGGSDAAPSDGQTADQGPLLSCNFDYAFPEYPWPEGTGPDDGNRPGFEAVPDPREQDSADGPDPVAHLDPEPPFTWSTPAPDGRDDIVMPGYTDDMPPFARSEPWYGKPRCFELPSGPVLLDEGQAYDLYRSIAELTTGIPVNTTANRRSVLGIRGAYPGTFAWHGNAPDQFNDTLVLFWREADGTRRVLEFAAHTDTGANDFGEHASSSLRPNRRYHYANGWHKSYNALSISEQAYQVRDDANKNGHWDSDRNGWLPPLGNDDHDRTGSAHNIHMASVDAPLESAVVQNWSAGCQTIPGIASWTRFIQAAWTGLWDPVDYFLVDARDIDPMVWTPCTPNGSHTCPFRIELLPYYASGNTAVLAWPKWPQYNCSVASEAGPEVVYLLTIDTSGTLFAAVDEKQGDGIDIDVHILYADDPDACLARGDAEASAPVYPGRYFIIADTYAEGSQVFVGPYNLSVWLE